jgi:hypothetical protein
VKRRCTTCDNEKPVTDFCVGNRIFDWCKSCRGLLLRQPKRLSKVDAAIYRNRHRILAEQKTAVTRLSPDTVRLIRTMYSKGRPVITIARGLNVERTIVSKIVHNKSYREVK